MIKGISQRILTPEYIKTYKIDFKNADVFIHSEKLDLESAVRNELIILKKEFPSITEMEFLIFRKHCQTYLIEFSKKMIAKSSSTHPLVRELTILSLQTIVEMLRASA